MPPSAYEIHALYCPKPMKSMSDRRMSCLRVPRFGWFPLNINFWKEAFCKTNARSRAVTLCHRRVYVSVC
jgi:hypothetical protein